MFETELFNKSRGVKCEVFIKAIAEQVKIAEENSNIVVNFLQKHFGVTKTDLQSAGFYAVFEKVSEKIKVQSQTSKTLNARIDELKLENTKIKEDLVLRQRNSEDVKMKCEPEFVLTLKAVKHDESPEGISRDSEPSKYSAYHKQENLRKR